jgi:hypothetical protein
VTLSLDPARRREFGALLQAGVAVRAGTGDSVLGFLTDQLGIHPRYVAERITTVFLDGKVVDALDGAVVRDGSSLALSAALPGLVGATMRRCGPYASMRAGITLPDEAQAGRHAAGAAGVVRVKLFNLLIEELGPLLLARGIVLDADEARHVLHPFRDRVRSAQADAPVFLRVSFPEVLRCR